MRYAVLIRDLNINNGKAEHFQDEIRRVLSEVMELTDMRVIHVNPIYTGYGNWIVVINMEGL